MRCPKEHEFSPCLILRCDLTAGHDGWCQVSKDGQVYLAHEGRWELPGEKYDIIRDGQVKGTVFVPTRFAPIGCTNVQANSQ